MEIIRNRVGMEIMTSIKREIRISTGTETFLLRTGIHLKGKAKRFPAASDTVKMRTENKACRKKFPNETVSASVSSYERAINPQKIPRKKKSMFNPTAAREIFSRP